jgi:hypothetical protein
LKRPLDPIAFFNLYLKTQWRSCHHFLTRYLDRITRLEIILFISAMTGIVLLSFHDECVNIVQQKGIPALQNSYAGYYTTLLLVVYLTSFLFARRKIKDEQITLLLPLPLPPESIAISRLFDLLFPNLFFIPLWMGFYILFIRLNDVSFLTAFISFFSQLFFMIASILLGTGTVIVFNEKKGAWRWFRRSMAVTANVILVLLLLSMFRNGYSLLTDFISLGLSGLFIFSSICLISYWSLVFQMRNDPENLYLLSGHRVRNSDWFLMDIFLCWVPGRLKGQVRKDLVFASRNYASYFLLFCLSLVVLGFQMVRTAILDDALQWLIFLSIIASYLFSNMGFKFSQEEAEDLRILRSLPVSAKRYWWAKFWISFLPVLWLIFAGHLFLLIMHPGDFHSLLKSLLPSAGIAFTLIYVQNNFALYSYPYSRYSVLWFNLYIILAVTFFTIFLFPPLAVAFLIFGYLAIFRVQHRFEMVEV